MPPIATYRVQLSKDFTFFHLIDVVPYLHDLGVSHLYLSPIFECVPGSEHGYDVTDFSIVSEERGGEDGLRKLDELLRSLDPQMHMILDIVPNHMAASTHNPYWSDVLRYGADSKWRFLFDIKSEPHEKIILPVLAAPLDGMIEKGKIKVYKDAKGKCGIEYNHEIYPLNAGSEEDVKNKDCDNLNFNEIKILLSKQYYEFALWSDVAKNVSYRRFFDVSGLVALRSEDPDVYRHTHATLLRFTKQYSSIKGIRVDHVDGLTDPDSYLKRVRRDVPNIWVEKILSKDEDLPLSWPVLGTTGYEFIRQINKVFIHPKGYERIEEFWLLAVERSWKNYAECAADGKSHVLRHLFPAELERLARFPLVATDEQKSAGKYWHDLTVALPVYRTYFQKSFGRKDLQCLNYARKQAAKKDKGFDSLDAVYTPLLLDPQNEIAAKAIQEWQKLSGPAAAKGIEDTAHYRYTPLAALNDVGCEPGGEYYNSKSFCSEQYKKNEEWPCGLNATTTHDTKRSEDARHSLYVLSEMPEEWISFYKNLSEYGKDFKRIYKQNPCPEDSVEYFIYQSLISIWPIDNEIDDQFKRRILLYIRKAAREAKRETSHLAPVREYEEILEDFILALLNDENIQKIISLFVKRLALCGVCNSLAVQALKILSVGVPDIFQGTEAGVFNLVDPDSRRSVDWKKLREILYVQKKEESLNLEAWKDGSAKLWLTRKLLEIRREFLSAEGEVRDIKALAVQGERKDHVIAYRLMGGRGGERIVIAMRYPHLIIPQEAVLPLVPKEYWAGTELDEFSSSGFFKNLLTGEMIRNDALLVAEVLGSYPVAILKPKN